MKTRSFLQGLVTIVFALLMLVGMATTARAADPWPWGQGLPWLTTTPWPTPRPLNIGERFTVSGIVRAPTPVIVHAPRAVPAVNSAPVPPANFAPRVAPAVSPAPVPPANFAPRVAPAVSPAPVAPPVSSRDGASPTSALSADGAQRTLGAGASAWYKIGSGGQHIDVFLDAKPLSGMALAVFAPGNLSDPIGQGTLQNSSGRLVWAGGHWKSEGDWLARVTNQNPMAVQYTLTSSGRDISKKSCYSYWESYPNGARVYWTECQ
ncbi:MAG: hypothetical protein FJ009_04090 [Chloroflexi bacterium]|nr:hypothetical protein [Chloroflexota bacterium]